MKRFIPVALALVFVLGLACPAVKAEGVDVKIKGQWAWGIGFVDNKNFYDRDQDNQTDDAFAARQRLRTQIDIVASEALRGVVMFEIGTQFWGGRYYPGMSTSGRGSGASLDADGVNVETKRAYLDWMVPGTDLSIRMGIQGFMLPSATDFRSPLFSGDVAGLVANYKFNDMVSATMFWFRPFDMYTIDADNKSLDDELDLVGLIVPLTFDGLKVSPWFMYAEIGGASGYWAYRRGNQSDAGFTNQLSGSQRNTYDGGTQAWYLGVAVDLSMFDPLSFRFDVMYGDMHGNGGGKDVGGTSIFFDPAGNPITSNPGSKGWFMDAILEYKLDWGTPGLFGWYSTGDDAGDVEDGEFGRLPVIGMDMGFGPTSFGTSGGYAAWGFDKIVTRDGVGTWGVGVQLADMTFIENLSHTLRFAYYRGTNDKDIVKNHGLNHPGPGASPAIFGEFVYMTDGDSVFEINFDHKYKMYENFTVLLELGWLHLDLDDVWKENAAGYYGNDTTDAWKAEFLFEYKF